LETSASIREIKLPGGIEMNKYNTVPLTVGSEGPDLNKPAFGKEIPIPYQMRAMSFVSIGATFRTEVVAALLPRNLTASDGCTGGFLVALAREGHVLAPFSIGHVWFDVIGHDGSAGPGRYLPRLDGLNHGAAYPEGNAARSNRASITECPDRVMAHLDRGDAPTLRLSVRPISNWTTCAGIDHSITGGDLVWPEARLNVTPWAAEWSDADPLAVEILSPAMADLKPVDLTWASIGRQGAMTLGLSAPL